MGSNTALEKTIDKILKNTEDNILSSIKSALDESQQTLDDSVAKLEAEYDKIIADGKKEADKIEKQIVGSSDLEARNKQLMVLEEAVDKVFSKALEQVANTEKNENYSNLIKSMINESTEALGVSEIMVYGNSKDKEVIQPILEQFSGAEMSTESIDCLGGITVKSKDGTMTFDNTIDARIERLKPLIRKEIATKFGVGN